MKKSRNVLVAALLVSCVLLIGLPGIKLPKLKVPSINTIVKIAEAKASGGDVNGAIGDGVKEQVDNIQCQIKRNQCLGGCQFSGPDPLMVAAMLAQCISGCPTC